jgi:RNA polymerase sigma-70 factor (ECF subfamily)
MSISTDKELLQRVSHGDKAAMRILYDEYAPNLRRFITRWIANENDASDILHDTMLEIWRKADRFQGRSSVKSWMFSIARNKAIDRNRKGARTVLAEPDENIADESPQPDDIVDAFQDAKRVRACIEKLSAVHKAAIHLAFFEGLTYPEIAQIEGCPVGTVKTRIMHAKKLLLRCLSD